MRWWPTGNGCENGNGQTKQAKRRRALVRNLKRRRNRRLLFEGLEARSLMATVSLSVTDNTASEPPDSSSEMSNDRRGAFTLTRTESTSEELHVTLVADEGTGFADWSDSTYDGIDNWNSNVATVIMPAGDASITVYVYPNFDEEDEGTEMLSFGISDVTGEGSGDGSGDGDATQRVHINIADNDPAPAISISDWSGAEQGPASFTVQLSAASTQTVTVAYTTGNGTASSSSDYTATSGTLTFLPGETTKTVSVGITTDSVDEVDELFYVTLSSPTHGEGCNLCSALV
jgi:hypothetical protein